MGDNFAHTMKMSEKARNGGVSRKPRLFPIRSDPSFDPGRYGLHLCEPEHELSHFSSMLLAVGGGARQGFKFVDLVVFDYGISTDYPTREVNVFGHGNLH